MALCYFVMCHRMQDAVAELVSAIWRPEHLYLLHVDAKAAPSLHAAVARLAALPNVHVLPARLCAWGGWTLVETLLAGIAGALALDPGWTHFLPLSEGHVPLRAPDAAALAPGVSCVAAEPAEHMGPGQTPDVRHRLAARYRELPGVGMFPVELRGAPELAGLFHASQWIVLARNACEWLATLPAEAWAPFRDTLIADEIAIPTVLLRGGGRVVRRPTTFVAWPHVSGNEDWTFSEQNFFAAREAGYLFVRKRPAVLPPRVAAELAKLAARLPELPPADDAFRDSARVTALAGALHGALGGLFAELAIDALLPAHIGGSATCYLRLRCPALPEAFHLLLLSEDFLTFKIALVWQAEDGALDVPRPLGGRTTWVLKVRLLDVFMQREVLLPELPDAGFVTLAPGEGPARLAAALARALAAGIALAGAA
jgi:hypothetical protein